MPPTVVTTADLSYLSFFVDQTGDTCWRLTSAQYFVSEADAEAALLALSALVKQPTPHDGLKEE